MTNCRVCREDIKPGQTCPRCGYDNGQIGEISPLVAYFGNVWGILSFGLILLPLFALMSFNWVNSILQPIASIMVAGPISLLVTAIIAFYMYSLRNQIHHYSLTRKFKKNPGRSVALLALIFFVIAILFVFVCNSFQVTSLVSSARASLLGNIPAFRSRRSQTVKLCQKQFTSPSVFCILTHLNFSI